MKNLFKKFMKEEDGATIIEYVIMLSVIAGIVMFAFPNVRTALTGWLSGMFINVDKGVDTSGQQLTCANGSKVTDISNCK